MSAHCEHDWLYVKDWYGDPNVIHGTADCSFWRCRKCGEETDAPDDPPNPYIYERDDDDREPWDEP